MLSSILQIVNISRPGEKPQRGDILEIECVGGWVKRVDPKTRRAMHEHQQFRYDDDQTLTLVGGRHDGTIFRP